MEPAITILAAFGIAGVAVRLARAALRTLQRGVDAFVASEMARNRARRGDLTGLAEAEAWARSARHERLAAAGRAALWLALLVAPALTPWPRELYAACAVLWLVPRARRR